MASSIKPFYFFLLPMFLSFSTKAQTHKNITLGSSLSAHHNDDSSWISPSGEFAFGFQQIENDGFLLAIWFNKISEKTVVWSANRNDLVRKGSKLDLTANGQLVLYDPDHRQIWSTPEAGSGDSYAAMLDTGNFVLATNDSVNVWESFDNPTDTLLPTQIMYEGNKLIARYLDTNYSTGRYQLALTTDGPLGLYTINYPLSNTNLKYWKADSNSTIGGYLIFNQSGNLYLEAKIGGILYTVFSDDTSPEDFYQRATLDSDGVFRHYCHPKSSVNAGKWDMAWSTLSVVPENICTSIQADSGSGACGYNSYCSMDHDKKPSCGCPNGYSFIDPNDVRKGCKPNFLQQRCDEDESDAFDYDVMVNTYFPYFDYEYFTSVSEDWCRKICLSDCFCAAIIYNDGECYKKMFPLSNMMMDDSYPATTLVKKRAINSTSLSVSNKIDRSDQSTLILVVSILLGSSGFVNILLLVLIIIYYFRISGRTKVFPQKNIMDASLLQNFTYVQLEEATNGFKEELGRGAFGMVYKGVLEFKNTETQCIAVKKLTKRMGEGEQEFKSEVSSIGRTNHKNLVKLIGFCNEGYNRLLVYEYMSNGSLAGFLFGESIPIWYKRVQICFGIARGLQYLHEECSNQIIHCDIKPQNILLDNYHTARISDFGLAKLLKTDQTRTTTAIRGTKGYVAPEWFRNMPITVKVDVYSFGILLLEIICCRKNFKMDVTDENQMILADWVCDCYKDGSLDLLVEKDDQAKDDMKRVKKFVMIAMWCIQEDPSSRPTMKKVTQMMEGSVAVSTPPDPSSFISSIEAS